MSKHKYHHGDLKNALIEAAVEILSEEGIHGLSLRKVASRVGVSHAAPYAHFTDKQALIAAISTQGFLRLYHRMEEVIRSNAGNPARQLTELACAYVDFALTDPDYFKITFSGVLEKEKDFPAFVEISQHSFQLLVQLVADCQNAQILALGPSEVLAVSLWSAVHGLASLLIEGQISHHILEHHSPRELTIFLLGQFFQQPQIQGHPSKNG